VYRKGSKEFTKNNANVYEKFKKLKPYTTTQFSTQRGLHNNVTAYDNLNKKGIHVNDRRCPIYKVNKKQYQ